MLKRILIIMGVAAVLVWPRSHAMASVNSKSDNAMRDLIAANSPESIRNLDTRDVLDALLTDGANIDSQFDSLQSDFQNVMKIKDDEARRTAIKIHEDMIQSLRSKFSEEMEELRFLRSMYDKDQGMSSDKTQMKSDKAAGDAAGH